jgi:hypothetical protein
MCYIWVSLRTWGVYVNANHNIITYITKTSSIYNAGSPKIFKICEMKPNTELMT